MTKTLRVAGVVPDSITDGPGFRFSVFAQGCPHHCPGCQNLETWPMEGGTVWTLDELEAAYAEQKLLQGATFSGGEPFVQAGAFAKLGQRIKAHGGDLVVYTGYRLEELLDMAEHQPEIAALLDVTDYLVDGPFIMAERDLSLRFRGSANQRLYQKEAGEWVAWDVDL